LLGFFPLLACLTIAWPAELRVKMGFDSGDKLSGFIDNSIKISERFSC